MATWRANTGSSAGSDFSIDTLTGGIGPQISTRQSQGCAKSKRGSKNDQNGRGVDDGNVDIVVVVLP